MAAYPAVFDITQPTRFNRMHVVIRILILVILAILGGAIGWLYALIWLALPVLAAILISQKGAQRYLEESDQDIVKWLRYIIAAYSYLGLLTDRLPNEDVGETLRFEVRPTGSPSAGQALLRIILIIPHLIVLFVLGIVTVILLLIAAIMILVQESYPEGIYGFLRGYQRWNVRVLAYLASLADEYPPFALDTGPEGAALPPASPQTPPP
jgi:TctA family transporter